MTTIPSDDSPEASELSELSEPTELSEPSEPSVAASSHPSGKSSLIRRCILFGILIVAVILLILDRKARSDSKSFYDALDKAIVDSQFLNDLDVQKLAGRKPAKTSQNPSGKKEYYEDYRWRGGFHSYTVYCSYQVAAEKLLNNVSYNQPLE
ncbi:MAG: hypothetical protein JW829_03965 [Pirellulales bacterium]|nr:hypothetical protein [Pirellulales bacterium]